MPHHHSLRVRADAFSLLEMAVVLTIMGLLVGAVVGGQRLLKQAELQTIITNATKYTAAFAQFRQQYGGFPGDMIDATSYWPIAADGNGNGMVINSTTVEQSQAWAQLVWAKMLEGSFTGTGTNATLGVNVPKGRINNSGWSFYDNTPDVVSGIGAWYAQDLGNMLAFGAPITAGSSLTNGPIITAAEAWQLDTKMDDGLPATGRVESYKPGVGSPTPSCTNSVNDASAQYAVAVNGPICNLNISLTTK